MAHCFSFLGRIVAGSALITLGALTLNERLVDYAFVKVMPQLS